MADLSHVNHNIHQNRTPQSNVNERPPTILQLQGTRGGYQISSQYCITSQLEPDSGLRKRKLTVRVGCICLHILLVPLHLALVIVWSHHFEHGVIVPLSRSSTISTTIVVASQFFISVCSNFLSVSRQQSNDIQIETDIHGCAGCHYSEFGYSWHTSQISNSHGNP